MPNYIKGLTIFFIVSAVESLQGIWGASQDGRL